MTDLYPGGATSGQCISLCNTTDENYPQEFKICRNVSFGECKSLRFQGILGQYVKTNKCISTNELLNCGFAPDPREDRIRFDAMYAIAYILTWALGVFALFGNVLIMCNSISLLYKKFGIMGRVKTLHNILLLNLSTADFLMGLFLLSHMVLYSKIGTPLSSRDYQLWKADNTCSFIGITGFVSSQVSVTTLILITSCRLYSVLWPYKIVQIKPVIFPLVLSWIVWTFVGCIPLLGNQDTFHNSMYVEDECFDLPFTATYTELVKIVKPMLKKVNCSYVLPMSRSWDDLFSLLDDMQLFNKTTLKTYPYYSGTNFCSPNYFNTDQNPALGFLLQIVFFNFFAFSYMALSYSIILRRTSGFDAGSSMKCWGICSCFCCSSSEDNTREQENKAMHRRIFLVVLTDFACWVPISLIAITKSIDESSISKYVTFYMIGFLLPVNSALNPFLYTNQWKNVITKLCRSTRQQKDESVHEVSDMNTNKTNNFVTSNLQTTAAL